MERTNTACQENKAAAMYAEASYFALKSGCE